MTEEEIRLERIRVAAAHYKEFLHALGFDLTGEMEKTPERVARMYVDEYTNHDYGDLPDNAVTLFKSPGDAYITVKDLPYSSLCSHHLMPFHGRVGIVYQPGESILGLSKFARIIKHISGVPCTQEAFTDRLATVLYKELAPEGIYLKITGTHSCMIARGVRTSGEAVTSAIRGEDMNIPECLELLK